LKDTEKKRAPHSCLALFFMLLAFITNTVVEALEMAMKN